MQAITKIEIHLKYDVTLMQWYLCVVTPMNAMIHISHACSRKQVQHSLVLLVFPLEKNVTVFMFCKCKKT